MGVSGFFLQNFFPFWSYHNVNLFSDELNSSLVLMPTFDKRFQWQKKPNNMKKMEKENIKI